MTTRKKELEVPDAATRRTVEQLFSELIPDKYNRNDTAESDSEYLQACDELSTYKEQMENDKTLSQLTAKKDKALVKAREKLLRREEEAKKVRRLYLAEGLTPRVQEELRKLVEKINKE